MIVGAAADRYSEYSESFENLAIAGRKFCPIVLQTSVILTMKFRAMIWKPSCPFR